jgi:hypothetical protein
MHFFRDSGENSSVPKGVCRHCGCTEEKPCKYVPIPHGPIAGQPVLTAKWADKTKTLCTNPMCLEKAEAEKKSG